MKEPKNYNEILNLGIQEIVQATQEEFSEADVRKLAMQMVFYLQNGAPYGDDMQGFYRWYKETGGTLDER